MIRFASPHMLWLLLLVPVTVLIMRARRPAALTFSSVALTDAIGPSLRTQLAWLPPLLRILALTAIIIAAARPQHAARTRPDGETRAGRRDAEDVRRDQPVVADGRRQRGLAAEPLHEDPGEDVERDQPVRRVRGGEVRIVVAKREHPLIVRKRRATGAGP